MKNITSNSMYINTRELKPEWQKVFETSPFGGYFAKKCQANLTVYDNPITRNAPQGQCVLLTTVETIGVHKGLYLDQAYVWFPKQEKVGLRYIYGRQVEEITNSLCTTASHVEKRFNQFNKIKIVYDIDDCIRAQLEIESLQKLVDSANFAIQIRNKILNSEVPHVVQN